MFLLETRLQLYCWFSSLTTYHYLSLLVALATYGYLDISVITHWIIFHITYCSFTVLVTCWFNRFLITGSGHWLHKIWFFWWLCWPHRNIWGFLTGLVRIHWILVKLDRFAFIAITYCFPHWLHVNLTVLIIFFMNICLALPFAYFILNRNFFFHTPINIFFLHTLFRLSLHWMVCITIY